MNQKYLVRFLGVFLSIFILLCIFPKIEIGLTDPYDWTIKDENLEVFIEVNEMNIKNAVKEGNALLIDPNGIAQASTRFFTVGHYPIILEKIKIIFLWADFGTFSQTKTLGVTLYPGGDSLFINQTFIFKDYLGRDIQFISGIYQLRYDLYYTVEGTSKMLKGVPFYVKLSGNPATSVTGVVTTAAVAYTAVSFFGLVISIQKSIQMEIDRSIESTNISPTKKLIGYYTGKSYKNVQNEISNAVFGYSTRLWRGDKCPKCGADWPESQKECSKCYVTLEKAQELYSKSLGEKSLNACKEVVDSVSGLSLSSIANKLGEGVLPTSDIVSVLTFSGFALVQHRVAKSWGVQTRKLVFTGLQLCIFSLFWIQACGIATISLTMLVVAIFTGTILPILISKAIGNNIKVKVDNYWNSKRLSVRSKL